MNQPRDRLAAANPVPNLRSYTDEQVTATVSMILSDAAQADEAVTKHSTNEIPAARARRRRHRGILGLFAGLIVVPTAAAAVVGGMHTGIFAPSPPDGFSTMNAVTHTSNEPPSLSRCPVRPVRVVSGLAQGR